MERHGVRSDTRALLAAVWFGPSVLQSVTATDVYPPAGHDCTTEMQTPSSRHFRYVTRPARTAGQRLTPSESCRQVHMSEPTAAKRTNAAASSCVSIARANVLYRHRTRCCVSCIIKQQQLLQRRDEAATRGLNCRHQADCARSQPVTSSCALDGVHPFPHVIVTYFPHPVRQRGSTTTPSQQRRPSLGKDRSCRAQLSTRSSTFLCMRSCRSSSDCIATVTRYSIRDLRPDGWTQIIGRPTTPETRSCGDVMTASRTTPPSAGSFNW